ncbi:MAG: hypothetical protein RLZ98_65 [Pseudomonadota bacterium]|jgi:predicted MFS family arabinose efflux permease
MNKPSLLSQSALVMLAGFLILFITGGSRFAIGLIVKPMVDDLGWERGTLSFAIAMFMVVSAVAMFIAGRLTDRFNARDVLAAGTVASAFGIGAISLASEPWHVILLFGIVFAIGNGMASLTPVSVLITRWFPGRTGLANGIAVSGMGLGQLMMVAVLAVILVAIGWRSVFLWLGIFNLLLLPVVLLGISGGRNGTGSGPTTQPLTGMTLGEAARTPAFWLLLASYAICGFQDFFVSTHVVAFAMDKGVETYAAGTLLALMGLTGVAGVIAAGAWSDRTGPGWPLFASFAMRFALFALILIDQHVGSVAGFALGFGITFWMAAPLTVIFVRDHFGTRNLGAISGLITMVHHIAGGIGTYIGGVLFDRSGNYDTVFWTMAALSLLAMAASLALTRPAPAAPAAG